jgi:hypothetical protein
MLEVAMSLSKQSIETLLDLVEIKLGCMEVYDREDARELDQLEGCRRELIALKSTGRARPKVVPFTAAQKPAQALKAIA